MTSSPSDSARSIWFVLLVALVYPTLITWVFFTGLGDDRSDGNQTGFLMGKTIQFLIPVVSWMTWRFWPRNRDDRSAERFEPVRRAGWWPGMAFGVMIAAAMLVLYYRAFRSLPWMVTAAAQVQQKVTGLGVRSPSTFVLMAVFYSVVHSFLEEYYWRWFVFGRLQRLISVAPAIAISSVGFMAHHVLVLAAFFGWSSFWTYFFSVSVAVGGAFWAWLYHRSGRLWGPWISHLWIDAAIFAIGYDLASPLGSHGTG